jgi:mitochondrial chaperone BCS1
VEILKKLYDALVHSQNQFASGGLLLMAAGSVVAMFRNVPKAIWDWFVYQTTISLIITDENNEFDWLRKWLEGQNLTKKARHIDIATGNRRFWWRKQETDTVMAPAPGSHWMLYGRRPVFVKVDRLDDTKSGERKESIKFRTLGRNQAFFKNLIQEVADKKRLETPKPKLFVWNKDEWKEIAPYEPRHLETVIVSDDLKNGLVKDIENFKNSREWYAEMGIPYHRGYLFEGPAGTGKTSLVVGLSRHFNAQVYILKINEISDSTLRDAVFGITPNAFVILEDIDCIKATMSRVPVIKEDSDDKDKGSDAGGNLFGVTLSGLLNVLDGMLAPNGVLFFMTTNHVEKLDSALIRPGRVDVQEHIGVANEAQKAEMYERFFPGKTVPQEYLNKEMTMADLQKILMALRTRS